MARPVIVTCAVTGGGDTADKYDVVPVTPAEIAASAVEAARAGAAVVHIHVRDPESGRRSMELEHYRETMVRIKEADPEVVVNLSTGAGGQMIFDDSGSTELDPDSLFCSAQERVQHIAELKPDICSLDMGSLNRRFDLFVNLPQHVELMAKAIMAAGVKPELEVFDSGHIAMTRSLLERGVIADERPFFQIVLGAAWGAEATTAAMHHLTSLLPENAVWAAFGISRAHFPMVAQAQLLGGHVRVGIEDNLYLEKGVVTPSNAALVEKAVSIIEVLGDRPATPAEAREILGLAA